LSSLLGEIKRRPSALTCGYAAAVEKEEIKAATFEETYTFLKEKITILTS
jgi:hypothetical protein